MFYDVDHRHRQALDASALFTVGTALHALERAIEDCRNAGKSLKTDPGVLLLARHLGEVATTDRPTRIELRRACMDAIADIRTKPALVSLARSPAAASPTTPAPRRPSTPRRSTRRLAEALRLKEGTYAVRSGAGKPGKLRRDHARGFRGPGPGRAVADGRRPGGDVPAHRRRQAALGFGPRATHSHALCREASPRAAARAGLRRADPPVRLSEPAPASIRAPLRPPLGRQSTHPAVRISRATSVCRKMMGFQKHGKVVGARWGPIDSIGENAFESLVRTGEMNHLVVGLGGTGGKVIAAFRKIIFNEFREVAPGNLPLRFLYVDSDPKPLLPEADGWKVLGHSVHLPEASKLLIQAEDLRARLANIIAYPGIKPWIGDREAWGEILGSEISVAAGGQKRRLGRFLFACKATDFATRLQTLTENLRNQTSSSEYTFHVVAGLAGGTGAGTFIDVVAKLRQLFGQPSRHRILGYLMLPDRMPEPNWNTGNYHAGAYAALTELNALSTGAYRPYDLDSGQRIDVLDPFNGVYLFEEENEKGYAANVREELPAIAADFLFQKIVVSKNRWEPLMRMETAENGDGTPETAPGSKVGERSKRFLAFGVKRLAIPEEEIDEYLGLSFARQGIHQLRYNNWQDAFGFTNEKRNIDTHSIVSSADKLRTWKLDDLHITQGAPILPLDDPKGRWRSLDIEWESVAATLKERARGTDRKVWLDELSRLYKQRFEENFRGQGVQVFFSTRATARKEMAREIVGLIESEFFADWRNGQRSIAEISDLLDALIGETSKRRDAVDDGLAQVEKRDERTIDDLQGKMKKWAGMSFLDLATGKPAKIFDGYALSLQEHHVHRSKVVAWSFAKGLLSEIVTELEKTRATVSSITRMIEETLKKVSDGIEERLKDADQEDLSGTMVRFYDPQKVRDVTRDLTRDQTVQREQTARIRSEIVAALGESPSFRLLENRLTPGQLRDRILITAEEAARTAHDTRIAEERSKVRGVSIIGKLRERYDRDPQALQTFVTGLVMQAGCFLTINPNEKNRSGPGIPQVPSLIEQWIVAIPRAPEHAEFIEQLKSAFRQAQAGAMTFIESETKLNEITIISLKNLFPLRHIALLPMLQQEYLKRIASNPRHGFEVHSEGQLDDYPALYPENEADFRKRAYAHAMAAVALGVIKDQNGEFWLESKSADGFDNEPLALGKSLTAMPDTLDHGSFEMLRCELTKAIVRNGDREDVVKRIVALVDGVKLEVGDLTSATYRNAVEAGKAAAQLVRAA
jgi:hypothetical protein